MNFDWQLNFVGVGARPAACSIARVRPSRVQGARPAGLAARSAGLGSPRRHDLPAHRGLVDAAGRRAGVRRDVAGHRARGGQLVPGRPEGARLQRAVRLQGAAPSRACQRAAGGPRRRPHGVCHAASSRQACSGARAAGAPLAAPRRRARPRCRASDGAGVPRDGRVPGRGHLPLCEDLCGLAGVLLGAQRGRAARDACHERRRGRHRGARRARAPPRAACPFTRPRTRSVP